MFFKRSNHRVMGATAANAPESVNKSKTAYEFFGCVVSDTGCVRRRNEDNYLLLGHYNQACREASQQSRIEQKVTGKWQLAGIFDGISSEGSGRSAEETARIFQTALPELNDAVDENAADDIVRRIFQKANSHILRENLGGTTATVLCTNRKRIKIFHLGDSRAYLYRNGKLSQFTRDQTLEQLKRDAGLYDPEDTGIRRDSHILTDWLGRDQGGHPVESGWISVQKGDHWILCSDGLYRLCADGEMERILSTVSGQQAQLQSLVDTAREAGETDNITCMAIRFYEMKKGGNVDGCV